MVKQKVVVLGTGGTIAGMAVRAEVNAAYVAAQRSVAELLQGLPATLPFHGEIVSEQVAQIDSKDMNLAVWQQLLRRCRYWLAQPEVQGLVITHGTDTLEETAYFLHATLTADKPIVLTCAMRPANAPDADGPRNLFDALALAGHPGAHGVMAVCAGTIHGAVDVQKVHPTRLDPFSSGEIGPLGHVMQGTVKQIRSWPCAATMWSSQALDNLSGMSALPRVEIVWSHADVCGATVDALVAPDVARRFGAEPVRGLVVAATGNGSIHTDLEAALCRVRAGGVRVVRATRCWEGRITALTGEVIPDAQELPAVKARVALALELARQVDDTDKQLR